MVKHTKRLVKIGLVGAIAGFMAALTPSASQAAWLKAETDRFIVYSDGREKDLVEFAKRLTTFDAALRAIHKQADAKPTTRKLEIYMLRGSGQLRRVRPTASSILQGYYSARPNGVYAVVVRSEGGVGSDEVLFHEYMHRFMLENFPAAYPGWLVEAYAEYFQTAQIKPDFVTLGHYSESRAYSLLSESWLPWNEVLAKSPRELDSRRQVIFYAQAWMLLHYMFSDSARMRQLDEAIRAIAAGEDPVEAFHKATGMDEAALTKALRAYLRAKIMLHRLPNPLPTPPAVTVSRLPPSADDLLLEAQRLVDEIPEADQAEFLADMRARAARHPGDRFAELTLARAEAECGDHAAAKAIVDRWLAKEPESVEVLRAAGDIHMAAAQRDPDQRKEHLRAARPYFGKAYQKDPDDFRILYSYAYARTIEPGFPSENELNVLRRAHELAPSVDAIAMFAGQALLFRGRRDEARTLLLPVANDPHGGSMSVQARKLLETGMAGLKVPSAEGLKPAP